MPDTVMTPAHQAQPDESWTRREILQQPETLRATQSLLVACTDRVASFLKPILAHSALRIVLTGAGSSSFIGESLAPHLALLMHRLVEAIPTTDLVSAPQLYLDPTRPTLLVSFGRSGNSPESIAAIELAEQRLPMVRHLILTCNAEGALARLDLPNACIVTLPEATHDRSFAMTSSFTAMTYAALAIFTGPETMRARSEQIAQSVAGITAQAEPRIAALARSGFQRIVYLGSGILKGLAREASLKLLELTDGALVTFADTPMGFRHGPKTVVNAQTLIVVFVSNDHLTRQYDLDLAEELRRDARCGALLAVSAQHMPGEIIHVAAMEEAADIDLLFAYVVPAQLLALHAAHHLRLNPDQPNASGTVNRVVKGVRIHAAQTAKS